MILVKYYAGFSTTRGHQPRKSIYPIMIISNVCVHLRISSAKLKTERTKLINLQEKYNTVKLNNSQRRHVKRIYLWCVPQGITIFGLLFSIYSTTHSFLTVDELRNEKNSWALLVGTTENYIQTFLRGCILCYVTNQSKSIFSYIFHLSQKYTHTFPRSMNKKRKTENIMCEIDVGYNERPWLTITSLSIDWKKGHVAHRKPTFLLYIHI